MEMVSDDDNRSLKKDTNSDSEGLMIDEGSNSSLEGKLNTETKENNNKKGKFQTCVEFFTLPWFWE